MNNLEAEQLFHRVARFPAPRRTVITRETPTVKWMPRYMATPPLQDQVFPRGGMGPGRGSATSMSAKGLRKVFA